MGKKAQALLELALFVGLMLMVLLAALSYQRNLREQKLTDKNVFEQTKEKAFKHEFEEKDIDGETFVCSGAIVSYSLNADRQANRIFQGGQRRTAASAASVYYSNAEDPPDLNYNYYNTTDISSGEEAKKLYYDRAGGTEDPEDGLKLSTADYFCAAYPMLSGLAQKLFNLDDSVSWWKDWGGYVDVVIRLATFIYLTARVAEALAKIEESEAERIQLAAQDEEMGEWGWRVCDEVHDGSALAGKKYVKEVTAQIYDIETEEPKSISYSESQSVNSSTRSVSISHQVNRKISRRYDVTVPDPTIPLASHDFEMLGAKEVSVDLSGGQSEAWN
ncbi:MAG: hypothetical protein PHC37_07615 [Candidatus Omnitrophica bacterium]|nr:hypothetical protein [Candidatus Omnitrophota bacterium]